ncbi:MULTISPECIES: gliding motility-associated C-terminal domain-containing protein [Flavobacteriaceae]|uniref:T9SS type B sorting domain-containing protein n=1 Tax=Flavobacteriaceae TaxID=49546 RepID=UPI001490E8C0|nr:MULTISPECIES: gliding motility-associated C-terminal domain-containing protein [Allomuricauda]MDC6364897.1 gliding motility-associated C-terminal domain-containing protein [Muricauda sp. AC10]
MKQPLITKFLFFILIVFLGSVQAQTVDMTVQQGPNVDVMVTVGSANVDLSTFENDLEQAMYNKGIPLGKLRVEAFQRSSISSDQADASDIFNSWNKMNFNGTEPPVHSSYTGDYFTFDSSTNRVIADFVNRYNGYGYAMYDPTGDISDGSISATFGLSDSPYVHAEVGFIFRKVDNQNFYAYIIDNHTYCGNISGYAPGDGYPAEGIIKVENGSVTLLALNTNSGNSGSATYGWDGNRSDMFAAYYNGQIIDFKIEMSGDNIKISRKGGGGSAGTDWIEAFDISDSTHSQGSYGFYVHEQSGAYFKDINIEKLELRAFKDVLREPQWRNSALRFNVNLDDAEVADFDVDSDLSEILMRTINENIHYIGWGTDTNKAQFERFVVQNNNQGTFINRNSGSWSSWIDDMAQYIYEQYLFGTVTAGDYFIAGTSVEIDVDPAEMKTNTANASYPSGRWKITHDETFFENDEGKVSWNGLYLEDVPEFYEKPGEYTFTFEDLPTAPSILYFHRKPIASFTYSPATGVFNDTSYDLDGGANNGIAQTEWKWKSVDAASTDDWTVGVFDKNAVPDGEYLVMLTVQDHQGTWSSPTSVFIELDGSGSAGSEDLPVAQFNIQPDELFTYSGSMSINIEDNSIDPYGRTIANQEWIVKQRTYDNDGNPTDTEIYNNTSAMTDFSAYNTLSADYIISLRVQTDTGVWSEPFYRTLSITHDTTNPTISATPSSGSIDTDTNIVLTFQDESNGSGFDVQRYVMVQSAAPPASDSSSWSSWSNSQSKNVSFSSGGTGWYIHAEAKDNAGNTATDSFGPYDISLIVGANDDLAIVQEDTDSSPIDVLYNDVYDTNNTPTVTITVQGTKGTATVNGSNQVIYSPNENENGSDTVTYELDDSGTKVTAIITISITASDDPPTAVADDFTLDENATLNEDVSTNDVEVDGDDLLYHLVDSPENASSFTLNSDGTFTYVHDGDESATDTFTYNFEDAVSFSSTVTVTLNINPVNDAPEGGNIALDVVEDVPNSFVVTDFTFSDDDPTDSFNGIQVTSLPTNGTLTYAGSPVVEDQMIDDVTQLAFTTGNGEFGVDYATFGFKVKDESDAVSSSTYTSTITALEDLDGDGTPDVDDNDDDGDGTDDGEDDFPRDPTEDTDTDGDGTGDNADTDDDNDGTPDSDDAFPLDENEDTDTDGDGTGDNADTDDDNDGTPDSEDAFPLDENEDTDTDGDGTGDNADTDDDNDGTPDVDDAFPLDENEDTDTDGDGTGDNADTDDDNDGTPDADDDFPLDENEDTDTDGDGTGDNADTDDDNDGTPDVDDAFPKDDSEDTDTDGDGTGDNADTDDDNDGTPDGDDDFPLDPAEDTDTDGDGTGDNTDTDDDNDGTPDVDDAFPLDENEDTDTDGDGTGDNADTDDDNDGTPDGDDDFPLDSAEDTDTDGDGTGDNADTDDDNDGTPDSEDAFPLDENEDTDTDGDGTGDNADTDDDNDGTPDADDDFPLDENEDTDTDGDGTGDNADTDDDNDGTPDADDDFPLDENEDTDTDGDGTGDNADTDDDNDGTPDVDDVFPKDDSEDTDTDGDGTGDNADTDDDNDGTLDEEDDFPKDASEDTDSDNDGVGDNADNDADNDGTPDDEDAFPTDPNEDSDADGDGIGDNADSDDDDDGIVDTDTDSDGLGDNIDTDDDNDGIPDDEDAFPNDATETTDTDGDGIGDNTDTDDDGDGYSDEVEEMEGSDSKDPNSTPLDTDNDGLPDSMDDDDDNDGVVDGNDAFPTSNEPLLVPAQAFTPNGDGNNDAWVIPGIDNYPNNVVKVYNRWGHEVFAARSYRNDWEGFYKTRSEKLPAGSYLYVIDLGNGSAPIQGWIFINY